MYEYLLDNIVPKTTKILHACVGEPEGVEDRGEENRDSTSAFQEDETTGAQQCAVPLAYPLWSSPPSISINGLVADILDIHSSKLQVRTRYLFCLLINGNTKSLLPAMVLKNTLPLSMTARGGSKYPPRNVGNSKSRPPLSSGRGLDAYDALKLELSNSSASTGVSGAAAFGASRGTGRLSDDAKKLRMAALQERQNLVAQRKKQQVGPFGFPIFARAPPPPPPPRSTPC